MKCHTILFLLCAMGGVLHAVRDGVYTIPPSRHLGILGIVKAALDCCVGQEPQPNCHPYDRPTLVAAHEYAVLWEQAQNALNIPKKDKSSHCVAHIR